jgi:heme o synthase
MRILFELTKFRISLFASLSALAGSLLARQELSCDAASLLPGIFLLACGSCAFNQYQERRIDAVMERTKGRPLPSGRLNPRTALWTAWGLILAGGLLLLGTSGWRSAALGLFAVFWYNGVYTYLKRKTAFAAIPGALVGVVPPVIGWLSGRGLIDDPRLWVLSFFFFIWQVPHFWLLLLDSAGDYERAGLPSLTRLFSRDQLKRIISIWVMATAVTCLLVPLFFDISVSHFLLVALTLWLVWSTFRAFSRSTSQDVDIRLAFVRLNIFVLLAVSFLSADRLLRFLW